MAVLSLRQIKSRIKSIENIKKVTKAMEMVAVSKLRAAERDLGVARSYSAQIERILKNLTTSFEGLNHPFFASHDGKNGTALLVISSDTGLCGSYNNTLFRHVDGYVREGGAVKVIPVGRKATSYYRKKGATGYPRFGEFRAKYSHDATRKITQYLIDIFLKGEFGRISVAYMNFETAARFRPKVEELFPISRSAGERFEYITEPDPAALFEKLIPLFIEYKMKSVFLSAFAAEHSARAVSMGEATENAKDLLEQFVLQRNKVRQANITTEINEVVSGADALKG